MPVDLWNEETCDRWHAALDAYDDVIDAQGVTHLADHDRWFREEFPRLLAGRRGDPARGAANAPYCTRDDLVRATKWKMARGVWRARNLMLVQGNEERDVEAASREALAAIPDPRRPILALTRLAGVGPATASAVLATAAPDRYPFFDDLVAIQIPSLGEVKFTTAYYLAYADRIRARAAELSERCPHGAGRSGASWMPHALDRALWSASGGKAGRPPVL